MISNLDRRYTPFLFFFLPISFPLFFVSSLLLPHIPALPLWLDVRCPYITIYSYLSGNLVAHGYAIWRHALPIYLFLIYHLYDM